jgi:hypothetical protein
MSNLGQGSYVVRKLKELRKERRELRRDLRNALAELSHVNSVIDHPVGAVLALCGGPFGAIWRFLKKYGKVTFLMLALFFCTILLLELWKYGFRGVYRLVNEERPGILSITYDKAHNCLPFYLKSESPDEESLPLGTTSSLDWRIIEQENGYCIVFAKVCGYLALIDAEDGTQALMIEDRADQYSDTRKHDDDVLWKLSRDGEAYIITSKRNESLALTYLIEDDDVAKDGNGYKVSLGVLDTGTREVSRQRFKWRLSLQPMTKEDLRRAEDD